MANWGGTASVTRPEWGTSFLLAEWRNMVIEPIRVTSDAVEILDQRQLPERRTYLSCTGPDDIIHAIQTLAVRGAPAIGVAGVYGLWLASRKLTPRDKFWDELAAEKERIKSARPTAVNLAWAIDRVWAQAQGIRQADVARFLKKAAETLAEEERQRNVRIAANGAPLLLPQSRVLTHCNTGSLATVGVGTALGVIREGFGQGRIGSVWVDETRPLLQGSRLTAWELMQDRIPATLITDNMAASLMAQKRVDAVIVGADRICANGDTANKIGTYGLAVLAYYHGIPFYVAAPLSTVDLDLAHGSAIPIEERGADEVRSFRGVPVAPSGVYVYNPAFDVTPGHLITAIITDRGVARRPYELSLAALMENEPNTNREGERHA